jgi:hypothetical protein
MYRNYALLSYDRKHNFEAFGNYALPFGKGKKHVEPRHRRRARRRLANQLDSQPRERNPV